MEDQRPDTSRNNDENMGRNFSLGTWGRRGKRRKGARVVGNSRGLRLGNVAKFGLTSADFGVPLHVLRGEEEEQ